jgi:hypothetical protein
MDRIPWPSTHTGLTADDLPYGYSVFNHILDDGRGYAPAVVGHDVDEDGRTVILVALSPGRYVPVTMVMQGGDLGHTAELLLEAMGSIVNPGPATAGGQDETAGSPPVTSHESREATT